MTRPSGPPWVLRLNLDNARDRRRFEFAFDLEDLQFAPSVVEDLRLGTELGTPILSFDQAITAMKDRDRRRAMLRDAADKLACSLADCIEDWEGWHGDDRRDRTRKVVGSER